VPGAGRPGAQRRACRHRGRSLHGRAGRPYAVASASSTRSTPVSVTWMRTWYRRSGPAASKSEVEAFRKRLINDPDDFIAQPTLELSTSPTLDKGDLCGRHVDLRPFVLSSPDGVRVAPGGLTRVALKPGSLVVNSSQGGGTKDTWVLDA